MSSDENRESTLVLDAPPLDAPPIRLSAPIPLIFTNQQLINVLANAAHELGLSDWALLEKAELDIHALAQDREARYVGEEIEQLPHLNRAEQAVLRTELLTQLLKSVRWRGLINAPAGLNIRIGPGTDQPIVTSLPHEALVQVLAEENGWLFVVADGEAGYVHGDFVSRQGTTGGTGGTLPQAGAGGRLTFPPGADGVTVALVNTWNRFGTVLTSQAARLGIDPVVALAVLVAESRGEAFSPDGRMIIRFENHIFYDEWGKLNQQQFSQHFQFNRDEQWRDHRWRADPNGEWQTFHGNQATEWQVFTFARSLDERAAMRSISMGAPQIMGFNHGSIGYGAVQEMFTAFQADEQKQIEGFFRFVESKRAVAPLQRGDYHAFATIYNGSGQAHDYANIIRERLDRFRQLQGAPRTAARVRGALPVQPDALPMPSLPQTSDGRFLADVDPELYAAWRKHIEQGFEHNNEMFSRILDGFMNPYYVTVRMNRILFGVGIGALVVAALLSAWTGQPSFGLIFGGVSAVTFVGYFLSRPMQKLEENLRYITWLGIVYNSYWTRLAYISDVTTVQAEIDDATQTALTQLQELASAQKMGRG